MDTSKNFRNIVFYNQFHNGDLHLSREFVKMIIASNPKTSISYLHNNSQDVLKDLHIPFGHNMGELKHFMGDFIKDDSLYINTWYGCNHRKYIDQYKITFDCLYFLFKDVLERRFNFDIAKFGHPHKLFPKINYNDYKIGSITKFMSNNNDRKKVFISSGHARSGQATFFDMITPTATLAKRHPNVLFFVSNRDGHDNFKSHDNIIFTPELIKKNIKPYCDLNENSYISTFCDLIVGRYSGTFTFSYVQDNLFRNAKFICFHNYDESHWLGSHFKDIVKYKASFFDYKKTKEIQFFNVVNSFLQ